MINNQNLYVGKIPLLWIGTDSFISKRGKKLAKFVPKIEYLIKLLNLFEERKIKNIHYWISSDPDSTWEEFIDEFILIDNLRERFEYFNILAHAPFLIPYSTTPLYSKLLKTDKYIKQIVYKDKLICKSSNLNLYFPERVITNYEYLNKLLLNEKTVGNSGFFDYFKDKKRFNSFLTVYNFLKKERIEKENNNDYKISESLKRKEFELEEILGKIR